MVSEGSGAASRLLKDVAEGEDAPEKAGLVVEGAENSGGLKTLLAARSSELLGASTDAPSVSDPFPEAAGFGWELNANAAPLAGKPKANPAAAFEDSLASSPAPTRRSEKGPRVSQGLL